MKKSKVCTGLTIMILFLGLTGCGTKTVSYDDGKSSGSKGSEVNREKSDEDEGGILADVLGVEEEWKEEIVTDAGITVLLQPEVRMPEVSELYSMEVSQYYLTPEDKKRVAEYFMEPGSIQVALECIPTKESIAAEIKKYETFIDNAEEEDEDGLLVAVENEKENRFLIADCNADRLLETVKNEKETMEKMLIEAPNADDVENADDADLDPGDYSQDYYTGTREGKEYALVFGIDKEDKQSSWSISTDPAPFNSLGAEMYTYKDTDEENKCSISKEEAERRAVKICEELGITDMTPVNTMALEWQGKEGAKLEINGYSIILARNINGIAVEPECFILDYDDLYRTTGAENKPYEVETVTVNLNDNGIISMSYKGILSVDKINSPVKLLAFEQIKEVFRKEIVQGGVNDVRGDIVELVYMRLKKAQDGKYTYIPVWRMVPYEIDYRNVMYWDSCIFVNAIDGSLINIKEQELMYYLEPKYLNFELGI